MAVMVTGGTGNLLGMVPQYAYALEGGEPYMGFGAEDYNLTDWAHSSLLAGQLIDSPVPEWRWESDWMQEHLPRLLYVEALGKNQSVMPSDYLVSERLKEAIEALEPGVHRYYPVDLFDNISRKPLGIWYWWHIQQHAPLDLDRTRFLIRTSGMSAYGREAAISTRFRVEEYVGGAVEDRERVKFRLPHLENFCVVDFVEGSTSGMHCWRASVGDPALYHRRQLVNPVKAVAWQDQAAPLLFCSAEFWQMLNGFDFPVLRGLEVKTREEDEAGLYKMSNQYRVQVREQGGWFRRKFSMWSE